jgi:hypothetical protein
MQELSSNQLKRNINIAANLRRYQQAVVSEHAKLIDNVYPSLDPLIAKCIMEEHYNENSKKWENWPTVPSEKLVFNWLENLGVDIKKACAAAAAAAARGKSTTKEANSQGIDPTPITFSSRIIFHGAHPIGMQTPSGSRDI